MPDRDHWSASMLMRWVLTRDSRAVMSMVNDYGGWLVEGDNVTRIRPHSWDDVIRSYLTHDALPKEEKTREAVLKMNLFVIPAQMEIYSSLRRGEIDAWARPNGSGDIVKITPIQWAALRFHAVEGHDTAVPVDAEQDPLLLPRPLADYLSGSVLRRRIGLRPRSLTLRPPRSASPLMTVTPPGRDVRQTIKRQIAKTLAV